MYTTYTLEKVNSSIADVVPAVATAFDQTYLSLLLKNSSVTFTRRGAFVSAVTHWFTEIAWCWR